MDRFSNAAVEVGVERFFRVVAAPKPNGTRRNKFRGKLA